MPQKYFFIINLRFIMNGFIHLYQDIHNNLKRNSKYDITSNRRKSSIEFNVYFNLYIDHPRCD